MMAPWHAISTKQRLILIQGIGQAIDDRWEVGEGASEG